MIRLRGFAKMATFFRPKIIENFQFRFTCFQTFHSNEIMLTQIAVCMRVRVKFSD